jgi:hypothetical protein
MDVTDGISSLGDEDTGVGDSGPDRFDVAGGNYDVDGQAEGGIEECDENVDIVFVMDVSTSMEYILSKLAEEILVVDAAMAQLPLPDPPHYGLVVFVDDTEVAHMAGPYLDVSELQADFEEWAAFTSTNYQVHGGNWNDTWPENSLDALYRAADEYEWRPSADTLRMIIHTTDDTFWDGPMMGNGVPIMHGYQETVERLQEQEIRVFSFAAKIGGQCQCEDVTRGWFAPYQGQPTLGEATDGGVWDIDLVKAGQTSLAEGINGAVEESHCVPYPTPP